MGTLVAFDLVDRVVDRLLNPHQPLSLSSLRAVLSADPASARALRQSDVAGFDQLATCLEPIARALADGEEDTAAEHLNDLLRRSPTHPHLAKQDDRWRLHHHPADIGVVSMWSAICAESLSRLLAAELTHRIHSCADSRCERFFFDSTRSATRRFCSTTCQNRIKAATFRANRH